MSNLAIIYEDENGGCVLLRAVPSFLDSLDEDWSDEEKLIHVADRDLKTGQRYEIVNLADLPERRFFHAWKYVAGESERESDELGAVFKAKYGQELSDSEKSEVETFLAAKAKERLEQVKAAEAAEAERLANQEVVPANPRED